MNFSEIKLDVYDRTGAGQAPESAVTRRIGRYVNGWNRKVLTMPGFQKLRRVIVPKASIADVPVYGIALSKIEFIYEATTERRIYEKSLAWYRDNFPDPANLTGTPNDYVPTGAGRIHTRPAAACELFVKSTSVADTAVVVRVEAIRSNGYPVSLTATLTGVTAVTLSAAFVDVIDIVDFHLDGVAAGLVTLHEISGAGAELSRIQIGATSPRFLLFALAPTPAQAIVYHVEGIAEIVDMSRTTDEPFPSPDFHDILVMGSVHDEWIHRGRVAEARVLMHGGDPRSPTPDSILGRIAALRMWVLEWDYGGDDGTRGRSFEETIALPII